MIDIAIIGEVMIELTAQADNTYSQSVAGDTYNTACTLQCLGLKVVYVTDLGTGPSANSIRDHVADFTIQLLEPQHKTLLEPGSYTVSNDSQGERSFEYNRNNSAANALFNDVEAFKIILNRIPKSRFCYFSGITLALMNIECRQLLGRFLTKFREQGGKVILDPNYRPIIWESQDEAQKTIAQFRLNADIYLPGLEEEALLYAATSSEQVVTQLMAEGMNEIVIKNGAESCTLLSEKTIEQVDINPSTSVVDTTGAGDTFNGGYIGARCKGVNPKEAIIFAASAAAMILNVRGGVLPKKQLAELKVALNRINSSKQLTS
jgi:2-dehydro-3-deoxygluconokinase